MRMRNDEKEEEDENNCFILFLSKSIAGAGCHSSGDTTTILSSNAACHM